MPQADSVLSDFRSLDADDASKLSFLAYAFNRYGRGISIAAIVDELKTDTAREVAKALVGEKTNDEAARHLAEAYRVWIQQNSGSSQR